MWTAPVKTFACAFVALLLGALGRAQAPCLSWGSQFANPGTGVGVTSGVVLASVEFDDGSGPAVYIGGAFNNVDGHSVVNIARWDGLSWSAVGTQLVSTVNALAVYDDGSGSALYAGGNFAGCVARWNGMDWVTVGTGLSGTAGGGGANVRALAVYDDGAGPALFATGTFAQAGSTATGPIAKWDGASWTALGSGLAGAVPGGRTLTVFDDGSGPALFVGGTFNVAGGISAPYVAKWNGSLWSALGAGLNNVALGMAVFDDGSGPALYVAGSFIYAGGNPAAHIARWNGTTWSALGTGLLVPPGYPAAFGQALQVYDDGSGPALYAGGYFLTAGGTPASCVAKWNGSVWSALGAGASVNVQTLCAFDLGQGPRLFAGGLFTQAGQVLAKCVAQWNGSAWATIGTQFPNGVAGTVRALTTFNDGTGTALYAGGSFTQAGFVGATGIAKWNGASWAPLPVGPTSPVDPIVSAFEEFPAGTGTDLIVAGNWTMGGSTPCNDIARWNGTVWSGLGVGVYGTSGSIRALRTFNSGSGAQLYAGGSFTIIGGIASQNLARWTGAQWQAVGSGLNGQVNALAVFDDGSGPDLYIGGTFTPPSGSTSYYIARWNGTAFSSVGTGIAMNNHVYSLVVFDDGTGPALYAGGYFTTASGVAAHGVARWNGTAWSALGAGVGAASTPGVLSLTVFDDGDGPALYAGGDFTMAGDVPALGLARWDGTNWSSVGSGVNGSVYALAEFDDGAGGGPDLYAGGTFTAAGMVDSKSIAEWRGCAGTFSSFCFGDGSVANCPCGNPGVPGHGCENSAITGGALLAGSGTTIPDTVLLSAAGMPPGVSAILLQGDARLNDSAPFGDGLRCVAGQILRMYIGSAVGGAISEPAAGAPTVSARSAALGHPIPAGAVRYYQSYYRDPQVGFCPAPAGNLWNVTNGVRIVW